MATTYYTLSPPCSLTKIVKFFWVLESDKPYYCHRSMADVCAELIFHYKGQFDELKIDGRKEKSALSAIQGQSKITSKFCIESSFGVFGTYFYPYALPMIFGISATEFSNQYVDLPTIAGREGKELEEKMMLAKNNQQRVVIVSSFLERKLHNYESGQMHAAICTTVQTIVQTKGAAKVHELAQLACLSERQFERNFSHLTGFSPKLFSRIVRFHAAFNSIHSLNGKTLTELALSNGYYDQSHFIEDFKAFSGLNPKAFFSGKAEGLDWMHAS